MNQPTNRNISRCATLTALVFLALPAAGLPCPAHEMDAEQETDRSAPQALSPDKNVQYTLEDNQVQARDLVSGSVVTLELPPNFPRFSWPSGMAYDSRRDLVSVVSYGGDGCWYRYDVRAGRWLDFRSLNGLDLVSLTYDAKSDRYTARTGLDRHSLLFVSGDLKPLFERPLPGQSDAEDTRDQEPGEESGEEPIQFQFGPPVLAEYLTAADGLLELSAQAPPRHLADGAEIVVITGYEPPEAEQRGSGVRVTIDRPGKRVVLVLAAYETVHWQVRVKPGTRLAGILAAGYHQPFVSVDAAATVHGYRIDSSHADDSRGADAWRAEMQRWFGVDRVDVFRTDYTLPADFLIDRLDAPKPGQDRKPGQNLRSEPNVIDL